ncbi:hypothetical protein E8E11_010169 [Didymella keratinophila]|nr:hypothetical protein E8E11_010169 [Didymella keratinophila]
MNATSGVISDGVLWASTPLFAAAHFWSWHPLWAAGIWTAYGTSALFPQGEALLSRMSYSPFYYNLNLLHSPICGLKCGSMMLDVPTNSGKNTKTSVWLTSIASTFDSEFTTRPSEHDTLTAVTNVEATSNDDHPALIPTGHWNALGSEESQADVSVSSSPGIADNLARGTVLGENRGHTILSHTRSSLSSSKTTQYYTSSRSVAYEGPTSAIDENPSIPSNFRWLGRFRIDLSQSVDGHEIWGHSWQSWMADLTLKLLPALVVIFVVAKYLLRAFLKVVGAFTTTVAPPNIPALNTTVPAAPGPAASAQAMPTSIAFVSYNPAANTTEDGPTSSCASADQQATFH